MSVRFSPSNKTRYVKLSLYDVLNQHTFSDTKLIVHIFNKGVGNKVHRLSYTRDTVPNILLRPDVVRNNVLDDADFAQKISLTKWAYIKNDDETKYSWPCVMVKENYQQNKKKKEWSRFFLLS